LAGGSNDLPYPVSPLVNPVPVSGQADWITSRSCPGTTFGNTGSSMTPGALHWFAVVGIQISRATIGCSSSFRCRTYGGSNFTRYSWFTVGSLLMHYVSLQQLYV